MSRPFVGCRAPSGWRCGTLGAMNLLTLTCPPGTTSEDVAFIRASLEPIARSVGAEALVLSDGIGATLTHDPSELHARLDRLCDAIEALVAVAAASLPDEPPEPEDGFPQPLSRPR